MKRLAFTLFLTALAVTSQAQNIIRALVTVTNVPVTSNTLVVNAVSRYWTNAQTANTFLTNLVSINHAKTNLYNQIALNQFVGVLISTTNTNSVVLLGDSTLTVSAAGNWASIVLSTNVGTNRQDYIWPVNVLSLGLRTNQSSDAVYALATYSTNTFGETANALTNHVNLGQAQTIGNKTLTNSVFTGRTTNTIHTGNIHLLSNGTIYATTLIGVNASGNVGALTNGTLFGMQNIAGTNSGWIGAVTNGYWTNGIAQNLTVTNLSSPGNGSMSMRLGNAAVANGSSTLAVGDSAQATTNFAMALGQGAQATNYSAQAIGTGAVAGGTNSVALGAEAVATGLHSTALGTAAGAVYPYSTAIGYQANASTTNEMAFGNNAAMVVVRGAFRSEVGVTNLVVVANSTNILNGAWSWPVYSITSLANGNNLAVPFGSNTFIRLGGTVSAVPTIVGIVGGATAGGSAGEWKVVHNDLGFSVILSQNTVDPTAANRIETTDSADVTILNNGFATLRYGADSRWHIESTFPATQSVTNLALASGSLATNTASFTLVTNDFVLNTYYTNVAQRGWVQATIGLTNVLGSDNSWVALYLDQDANGTWEMQGIAARLQGIALLAGSEPLSARLQPSARFIFTNLTTGTATASVVANSSQWVKE